MAGINFDPLLNTTAGYLNTVPDSIEGLKAPHGDTLLHLVFWVTYTRPGREFMRTLLLEADGSFSQANRQKLTDKMAEFGVTGPSIVLAFIEAHVAALKFKLATERGDAVQKDIQTKAYQQYTSFLTWTLWEDAQDHEFSMIW